MKKIKLGIRKKCGTPDRIVIVDDEDYEKVIQYPWYCDGQGYAIHRIKDNTGHVTTIWMHRFIIDTPKGFVTDHINGNRLDNRRSNLRICNHQQNQSNRHSKNKNNTSGFKGVIYSPRNKLKWQAKIKHNYETIYIGRYATPEEASGAYQTYAHNLRGEYHRVC